MNELAHHIQNTVLIDTHEHLNSERDYVDNGPDVLQDLFDNYVLADLVVAGASPQAVDRLIDKNDPDVAGRFAGVRDAWELSQHTGYGEAVRLIAQLVYDMDTITIEGIEAARTRNEQLRRPGERLRLLRDVAKLDHVQIDNFCWPCRPDPADANFFLYDLSWMTFCQGEVDPAAIVKEVGIDVHNLASLRAAMEAIFARYGPSAIAVKTQHAYRRTLLWQERDAADVERALQHVLAGGEVALNERLCLGDWCLAQGVELAIAYNLPFKIHTGYYAGHSNMPVERVRSGLLTALLARYPQARFVLMHTAYPYSGEIVALAKHYPNTYMDMCWAWSIDPWSACEVVRKVIHAVPANKLFAFGGDTFWPSAAVAYTAQARTWLTRALQAEVDDGLLTEREAIALATRFMRANQEACFDLAGTRAAIAASSEVTGVKE